ncbi:MAG: TetR/AcrR family transcriptional regulator [Solirubrobacteraceae bacterium]
MTDTLADRTQAQRRARTRDALLESAARGLSRYGYGNLVLERVAADAGYTRGALYHQFAGKEDLALAVVAWVQETWMAEVGALADRKDDPLDTLLALARGHAIVCRRDIARVRITLAVEFAGRDHPIGRAVQAATDGFITRCARLITAARKAGSLPAGPPPRTLARALFGALEGVVIQLDGDTRHDELLAERAVRGVLGA